MTLALAESDTLNAPATTALDPLRRAMRWQGLLTVVFAIVSGYTLGLHGAISAALGGLVSIAAAGAFSWVVRRSRSLNLMDTMMVMLAAEAAKMAVIVVGLLMCFLLYREVVGLALVATFIVTTLMFAGAAFMAPRAAARK